MVKYTGVFAQAADESWGGYVPDLPTILVNGDSLEEAQENMRTGIELWIKSMKEEGLAIPNPTVVAAAIEVAA